MMLKTRLKNALGDGFELQVNNININGSKRGCSGFIINKKTGRIAYINTEVNFVSYLKPILLRTAEHTKDYHGGINHLVDEKDILKTVLTLTAERV
jgi:hypothetical protein